MWIGSQNSYSLFEQSLDLDTQVLTWTKPEDGEALNVFLIFLTAYCNTITEVNYMEELDDVVNLKATVAKLPFKLYERWRSVACSVQEQFINRVKFKNLFGFINEQVKIALYPVFGDIK